MSTPQVGIFLSETSGSAKNSAMAGSGKTSDGSVSPFDSQFEQAMGQLLAGINGNESPHAGTTLPSANALNNLNLMELEGVISGSDFADLLPAEFMADLQASLESYFEQLGDLSSLTEQELNQAFEDIAQQFIDIGASYGVTFNMESMQSLLRNYSGLQAEANALFARSQGLETTFNGLNLQRQNGLGVNPMQSATLETNSLPNLDSLHLLKQTVEAQTLASSSVMDGLQSMMSSTAATSMAMSLDDLTTAVPQTPVSLYSQPQQHAVEDAEVSLQKIPVPPTNRQFPQELGDRIMVMASKNIQTAEIQLTPPELGSLMVKISVESDQTSVVFSSPNSGVREALEQQSFRLKDMLEEKGLDLVDVDVSDQQKDESQADELYAEEGGQGNGDEQDPDGFLGSLDEQEEIASSIRLVDYYA